MKYIASELHCHTLHSDGGFTPKGLQQAAVEDGIEIIALTDHNTFSGISELDEKICPFIRGIEWTTYFGHMLVLGAEDFIDWRDAVPDNIDEKISAVKKSGGIVGIAHPFQCGSPICTGGRWEFNVKKWENVDYMEIWHEELFHGSAENINSVLMWNDLLDKGYRIAAVYGRDWHRPSTENRFYGRTYLGVDGCLCGESALEAIKNGRTVVSAGALFYFNVYAGGKKYGIGSRVPAGKLKFEFTVDTKTQGNTACAQNIKYEEIFITGNGGNTIAKLPIEEKTAEITVKQGAWYRAELWGTVNGEFQMLAVTSPIYT